MKKRYVALLRAISNVSMTPFRAEMEELGFTDVESYGMSGNLLFNATRMAIDSLEQQITDRFGTPAMVRTDSQLKRVLAYDPFDSTVLFLARVPNSAKRWAFSRLRFKRPVPVLSGKTVYYVHPARLEGKRTPFDFEEALGVPGTARSGRVIRQIFGRMSNASVRTDKEPEIMELAHFQDIQIEFMARLQQAVYCNVASVDRQGRPRSRVMHVVWDGPIGWVITSPGSHKAVHLAGNPFVSLAYISNPMKPVYAECTAAWVREVSEKQRVWDLHKTIPPPLGFDPTSHYGSIENELYGLLQFIPWRVELAELRSESLIWRPGRI